MSALELALCAAALAGPALLVLTDLRPDREPDATEPDATEPDATEPDATESEVVEPDATGSEVVEPEPDPEKAPDPVQAAEESREPVDDVDVPDWLLAGPVESPALAPVTVPSSMLEGFGAVESDPGAPAWRRVSSAMALLVMTLVVAGAMGAGIYRGLLALKP